MVFLQQFIWRGFFPVALAVFLAVPACAENPSTSIVFVEAVPQNETSVSYRMMYLSADGNKRELLAALREPVDLIQCRDGTVTYVDREGGIWSLGLQSATPDLLARTTFSAPRETVGKVLLHQEENIFYAVINSHPGNRNLKANNRFQLKAFHFDGRERIIASGYGIAYAVYDFSPNALEVVSSNGLFEVDTSSLKTTRIVPFDSGDLPHLALIRDGHSVFSLDGGRLIQVKRGLFGKTVLHYKVNPNFFGVVHDFDDRKKAVLISIVDPGFIVDSSFRGDRVVERVVEIFGSGAEREVYRANGAIGSACYMRK
jgi:hypothetical protein